MNVQGPADSRQELEATLELERQQQTTDAGAPRHASAPTSIDVGKLYRDTGCFTYDPGFTSTANCVSRITYIDGDKGVLLYRGYPIEQLAEQSNFLETLLPAAQRRAADQGSSSRLSQHHHAPHHGARADDALLHRLPPRRASDGGHGAASVGALSAFYHDSTDINDPQQRVIASHRMIAKMPTIAAMAYKYSIGQPFIYPRNDLDYTANFLQMCFAVPCEPYVVNPIVAARARPHLHPARRSRAERVDLDRAACRLVRRQPVRLHRRRHRLPVGPGARRRQRGRAQDAEGDRHRRPHPRVRQARPRTRTPASA